MVLASNRSARYKRCLGLANSARRAVERGEAAVPERWTPDSWRKKAIVQVPDYPDPQALAEVEKQLASFPPLVFAGEARSLKKALARVVTGPALLLQGGDWFLSVAGYGANN